MPDRSTARQKRSDIANNARKPAAEGDLAAENSRLRDELAAARLRIADLEKRATEVINRIDWVIDSLHNLDE